MAKKREPKLPRSGDACVDAIRAAKLAALAELAQIPSETVGGAADGQRGQDQA